MFKDKAGKEVKAGDYIVYAQAWGRSAGMNYGKVLSVGMSKATDWNLKKYPTIRIVGVDSWENNKLQKPSTLRFSDRVLVVSEDQVTEKVLKALSKFEEG